MYRNCSVTNLLYSIWCVLTWWRGSETHLGCEFSGCLHWGLNAFHRWFISSSNSSCLLCRGSKPSWMVFKVSCPLIKYLEEQTKTLRKFIAIKWVRQPKKKSLFKQRQQLLQQRLYKLIRQQSHWVLALPYLLRGLAISITCIQASAHTPLNFSAVNAYQVQTGRTVLCSLQ